MKVWVRLGCLYPPYKPFWLYFWESFFQILQNSNLFSPLIVTINPFLQVHYTKFIKKNPYLQILSFLKDFRWNLKFSYIFRFSPLCMNEEKWKKSWQIKLLLRFILEQRAGPAVFSISLTKIIKWEQTKIEHNFRECMWHHVSWYFSFL